MKHSSDGILSYSVWASTDCSPSDFLCAPRRAPGFHSSEGKDCRMTSGCPALASDWCRRLQAWTLGLFHQHSDSLDNKSQVNADELRLHGQMQAETFNRVVNRLGLGAAEVKDAKDEEVKYFSTTPCWLSPEHCVFQGYTRVVLHL